MSIKQFLKKLFIPKAPVKFAVSEHNSRSKIKAVYKTKNGVRVKYASPVEDTRTSLIEMIKTNPFLQTIDNTQERHRVFSLSANLWSEMHETLKKLWEVPYANNVQNLQYCEINYKNKTLSFTMEIQNFRNSEYFTAWCPEINGCITQALSKRSALEQLVWAVVESVQLNADYLKKNYVGGYYDMIPGNKRYNFGENFVPVTLIINALMKNGFTKVCYGPKHMIFVNELTSSTFTLPYEKEISPVSQYCYDKALGRIQNVL